MLVNSDDLLFFVGKFAGIGSVQYGSTLDGIVPLAKALGLFDPIKKVSPTIRT